MESHSEKKDGPNGRTKALLDGNVRFAEKIVRLGKRRSKPKLSASVTKERHYCKGPCSAFTAVGDQELLDKGQRQAQ
ncbi:MAG: hypothetical protein H7Z75_18435 [Ferruginibacter sp.]|nr:hypothetical protein [Cytophagales bacterium]